MKKSKNKNQKNLNKKGFSLIEIIAVVAILGILSVIGIVSVNNIIQKGKDEHYKTAEKNLKLSAESYAQANRNYLPKDVGEMTKVTLRTLVENNYIEEINDYYDNSCDLDKSYVQIFKYSKTDYSYLTYLDCPDYSNVEDNKDLKPTISITMTNPTDNTVKKTTAKTTIEDDNKILSYSIAIYKNGNEVYTTGNVEANYEKSIIKTKDISSYTPGTIKVVVKATNIYGQSTTETLEKKYEDRQGPTCIISVEDSTRDDDDWTAENRKITVGCDDGEEGSGCTREEFTKTFKTDMKTGTITISDKAGNTTDCEVDVYIDKTAPETCTVSHTGTYGNNSWYVTTPTITLTSSDAMSGVKYKSLTSSATSPTTASEYNGKETDTQSDITNVTWYGYLEDYAGNKTECSSTAFKVDTTPPTTPSGGSIVLNGSVASTTLGEVSGSTDATSGLEEYRYYVVKNNSEYPANTNSNFKTSRTFTRECGKTYYAYAIAIDKAGNRSAVYLIGTAADGANSYSSWGACSKKCGGGIQTRTNTCALVTTDLSQSCETQDCCSKVKYVDGTTCTKSCGGGTLNRLAYSDYDDSRCANNDLPSGGSACQTQTCCSSVNYSDWSDWSACTATCGGGIQTRSRTKTSAYDGSDCGTETQTQDCGTGSCFSCSWSGNDVFGTSKGSHAGNYSSWVSASESWGNWCRANGTTCYASGGYTRICIIDECKGMTAKEVNNKYGCDYASLWCSCS